MVDTKPMWIGRRQAAGLVAGADSMEEVTTVTPAYRVYANLTAAGLIRPE